MSKELQEVIERALNSIDDTRIPEVIMQGEEEDFIAVRMCDIPYAETEGYQFYGTIAELM